MADPRATQADHDSSTDHVNCDPPLEPVVSIPEQAVVKKLEEKASPEDTERDDHDRSTDDANHDPHFEPIVSLPEQEVKTLEEDEEELFKMRAKLFRFDSENEPPEWKERGTGDVKLMKHKEKGAIRLLMRREQTLKVCANHYICPTMELKANVGSDRAWVWYTVADLTDGSPRAERLAIRFVSPEKAQRFKVKFDECKEEVSRSREETGRGDADGGDADSVSKAAEKLEELSVNEDAVSETPIPFPVCIH